MKTAISIPDPIFEEADRLARRLGMSRSQLYAVAVRSYLKDHETEAVTAALDKVYGEEPSALEPALVRLQAVNLPEDEW